MSGSTTAGNKRSLSNDNVDKPKVIFESSPITDRASTFIAHFHPHDANHAPSNTLTTGKPTSLTQTIKAFQNHSAFATADHRIAAWRRASTQRTLHLPTLSNNGNVNPAAASAANVTYTTSSDDDGEKYAGKRLERVLAELDVQGTVVVARWYGGVLLGPVRFTHIENVAKEAVAKWRRYVDGHDAGTDGGRGKRVKIGDGGGAAASVSVTPGDAKSKEMISAAEEGQRLRLVEALGNRDNSIGVLRALLAEKKKELQEKRATPTAALVSSQPTSSSESVRPKSNAGDAVADAGGESSQTSNHPASSAGGDTDVDMLVGSTVTPIPTSLAATKPQAMDYSQMPMSRLRQLEKARDATIAFILKQIDKAEAEEKEKEKEQEKERVT